MICVAKFVLGFSSCSKGGIGPKRPKAALPKIPATNTIPMKKHNQKTLIGPRKSIELLFFFTFFAMNYSLALIDKPTDTIPAN